MPIEEKDAAYVWDIVESCRTVGSMMEGVDYQGYMSNRMLQLAVERCLEIIGEAARNLSDAFRSEHSTIPWPQIIAQRNVISHEYGEVRHERIWRVATSDVPELLADLEPLLPPSPEDSSPV